MDLRASVTKSSTIRPCSVDDVYPLASLSASPWEAHYRSQLQNIEHLRNTGSFPGGSVVKNLSANTGAIGDASLIPASGRSPRGGNGNSLIAWRILWTEEPGGLWSLGLQRVGHDQSDLACTHRQETQHCTSRALGRAVTEAPLRTQLWKLWEPSDMLNLH